MTAFLDLIPVVAFVLAYWLADFKTAVVVIMIAMVLQIGITWLLTKTINKILLASTSLVVLMGSVGLILKNDMVFKWKPTVLYWLFAAIALGSQWIGERPLAQRILESVAQNEFSMNARDWRALNIMWIAYFFLSGLANIYVAYNFPEGTWVNFKLFGTTTITLAFIAIQAVWIARHHIDTSAGKQED